MICSVWILRLLLWVRSLVVGFGFDGGLFGGCRCFLLDWLIVLLILIMFDFSFCVSLGVALCMTLFV